MSEAGAGVTETSKNPSTISSQLQEAGLFIDGVQPLRGDGKDLVHLSRFVEVRLTTPQKATEQVVEAAKLCDSFNQKMKPELPNIKDPAEIIIGDVHDIISRPSKIYSFSAYSLVSLLSQGEYDENRINSKQNTLNRFKQMGKEEFSETLECVQQMTKLLNAKPDQLYAYTYFARRKLEQMIQKQKTGMGLTNLSLEELKNHPEGKRADSALKELLGKHTRIKQLLAVLEKSTLLKQKPAHIENHIDPLIN